MTQPQHIGIDIALLSIDRYDGQTNVMFKGPQPEYIAGCPMGRGRNLNEALRDLCRRVEIESKIKLSIDDY